MYKRLQRIKRDKSSQNNQSRWRLSNKIEISETERFYVICDSLCDDQGCFQTIKASVKLVEWKEIQVKDRYFLSY